MSNIDDAIQAEEIEPAAGTAPPCLKAAVHLESHLPPETTAVTLMRWKREDTIKRGCMALRGLGLLLSMLAFVILPNNKHGHRGREFDQYHEYRFVMAIAISSTVYTALQCCRQVLELYTGKEMISHRSFGLLDFSGDQIMAYLLISAASSAVPLTNRIRKGGDKIAIDSCAAAISMEMIAFFVLALSALLNGYRLANQFCT